MEKMGGDDSAAGAKRASSKPRERLKLSEMRGLENSRVCIGQVMTIGGKKRRGSQMVSTPLTVVFEKADDMKYSKRFSNSSGDSFCMILQA